MSRKSTDTSPHPANNYDAKGRAALQLNYFQTRAAVEAERAADKAAYKLKEDARIKRLNEAKAPMKGAGMVMENSEPGFRAYTLNQAVLNAKTDDDREKAQRNLTQFLSEQGEAILAAISENQDVPRDKKGQLDFNALMEAGDEARAENLNEEDRAATRERDGSGQTKH